MFGYIRPYKPELKMKEYEQFKACYCALCHSLGENYGLFSRMFLSYDFVFLSMLIWDEEEKPVYTTERCIACPFRKKLTCSRNDTLETAGALSVILTYWKLKDSMQDDRFGKALLSRICLAFLTPAYKKATKRYPAFSDKVKNNLAALTDLEKNNEHSIDKTADKFAMILSAAAKEAVSGDKMRILSQLLYHTGRWIYILDAVNDFKDDLLHNRYNPISARYKITDTSLSDYHKKILRITLNHSLNDISAAFQLLPQTEWYGVLMNIIYLGLPDVTNRVFSGEFEDINRIIPRNKEFRS